MLILAIPHDQPYSGGDLAVSGEEDDAIVYAVVINDEEQYSIWPSQKALPCGWHAVGKQGRKADCLKYIDEVWTDMRPASLRRPAAKPSRKK
jgi:MbtH protein